jgi:hypothetical protein
MMRRIAGASLTVLAVGSLVLAQAPQGPPKPGPEVKSLGYFVGKWKSEADMKSGPMGPGGKMTSNDVCEWFTGGFQVVCKSEGKGPMGAMTSMGVIAYNESAKAYSYYGVDSMGTSELSTGHKSGNTWTFTATSHFGGQTFQSRYTIVETSPTAYTFKWETSPDKKAWTVIMEGKTTKG